MLSHYFDSHRGGIEFVARDMFRFVADRDCEITWAAADASAPPQRDDDHTRALPLASSNRLDQAVGVPFPVPKFSAARKLASAVRDCDVVLLHDCLYLSHIAAFLCAKVFRVPVIIVQHTGKLTSSNPALRAGMSAATAVVARYMLRSASQVVFISETTRAYFRGVPFQRSPVVVFNGVDAARFCPPSSQAEKHTLRERFGIPSSGHTALFVGRFVEAKGIHVLRHLASMAPDVTWVFAGNGPLDPNEAGLPNVKVLSDMRQQDVADLYRACNVLVLPSKREGFPLVIQEALACGLPVVCTADITTADEALADLVRGVPLTTGDDRASALDFLSAIRDVMQSGMDQREVERRSQFVQSRYGRESAVACYREIIRRAVATGGRKHTKSSEPASAAVKYRTHVPGKELE